MDLGFSKSLKRQSEVSPGLVAPVDTELALLLAVATARQNASPTARRIALAGCGGTDPGDPVRALAHTVAPRSFEKVETAILGGSFCPSVAARLTVGQEA